MFLINSSDVITTVKKKMDRYKILVDKVSSYLTAHKDSELVIFNSNDSFVDHDPGKCEYIKTTCQRQFLISLGAYQPKQLKYLKDLSIKNSK